MTDRSELESTVQTIYKARQDNDIDALMAFFDPACSFRIVGSDRLGSMTQTVDDSESLRIAMTRFMDNWDFSKLNTTSLHVDGDTVFAHRSGQVRFIPSDVWNKDGLVVDLAEFIDTLQSGGNDGIGQIVNAKIVVRIRDAATNL